MESAEPMHDERYQRELGEGLMLRWSRSGRAPGWRGAWSAG
jgi:hypothetical protein